MECELRRTLCPECCVWGGLRLEFPFSLGDIGHVLVSGALLFNAFDDRWW